MTAIILRPILPWSGTQEEDHRFRRILVLVLAIFLAVGAILPHLPLPLIESGLTDTGRPPAVRLIARPVALFEPSSESRPPATRQPPSIPVPRQESAATDPPRPEPAKNIPPPFMPDQPVQPKPGRRISAEAAESAGTKPQNSRQSSRSEDPVAAAREKVANTGVLALSDSLSALHDFTHKTTAARSRATEGTEVTPAPASKHSLLKSGVEGGSGGIGDTALDPRELLGAPGTKDPHTGGSRGVVALQQRSSSVNGGRSSQIRSNTRSEEEIQEILDRNKHAIYSIYNRELRVDPMLQGKVVVSITIAPSGKVTDCTMDYSELGSDTLEKKLIRLIRGIDFGAKENVPTVTTKVPIEFFPV